MVEDYLVFLAVRGEEAVSEHTIRKYKETMVSVLKSLTLQTTPLVPGSVNLRTVRQWVPDQRAGTLPSARKGRPSAEVHRWQHRDQGWPPSRRSRASTCTVS